MKNKRLVMCLLVFVMMWALNGCSLAKADAGDENETTQDRLIGVFVTTEYLDLFNMDAYLKDNVDELVDGSEYKGRIYATVDKHDSLEPQDWEIIFGDVEGVCFLDAIFQNEGEEPFSMLVGGDEMCDVTRHLNVTSEGESIELTGTMYVLATGIMEEIHFYLNPVYQTSTGNIYVTSGDSLSLTGDTVGAITMWLEEEATVEENGKTENYKATVTVNFEKVSYEPTLIQIHYMDENLEIIMTDEYTPGTLPEQLTALEGTDCVVVETRWANGESTREFYELKDDEIMYIETMYKVNETALGKQSTEVIWE